MIETPVTRIPYPEPDDGTQTWNYWAAQAQRADGLFAPFVKVRRSFDTASGGTVTWNTAIFDPSGLWQGNEFISIPAAGTYRVVISATFNPSGNSQAAYGVRQGSDFTTFSLWGGGETDICFTADVNFIEGEAVRAFFNSNQGDSSGPIELSLEKVF